MWQKKSTCLFFKANTRINTFHFSPLPPTSGHVCLFCWSGFTNMVSSVHGPECVRLHVTVNSSALYWPHFQRWSRLWELACLRSSFCFLVLLKVTCHRAEKRWSGYNLTSQLAVVRGALWVHICLTLCCFEPDVGSFLYMVHKMAHVIEMMSLCTSHEPTASWPQTVHHLAFCGWIQTGKVSATVIAVNHRFSVICCRLIITWWRFNVCAASWF